VKVKQTYWRLLETMYPLIDDLDATLFLNDTDEDFL